MINNLFNNVGIENIIHSITKDAKFREILKEIDGEDDTGIAIYSEDKFLERLTDLVERRNQIAHGVPSTDIFNTEELKVHINYINSFLTAMFTEVYRQYLRLVIKEGKCTYLGNPLHVFPNCKVISFQSNHLVIHTNQLIIGYNKESNGLTFGSILSLRKETDKGDISINQTGQLEDVVIGVMTDADGRLNYNYYILENRNT